jgi:hypothetical protein
MIVEDGWKDEACFQVLVPGLMDSVSSRDDSDSHEIDEKR